MLLTKNYQLVSSAPLTYGQIRTYAKYNSQSTTNNSTTYSVKSVYYCNIAGGSVAFESGSNNLDGTTKNYGYTRMYEGETVLQEITRTIIHNSDGSSPTKNISNAWSASFGGSNTASATVTFPKINRLSTITLNNGVYFDVDTNENVPNIIPATLTKYVSDYTTKLKISLQNNNDEITVIREYENFDSKTFSFTEEELTKIYNATPNWKMFFLILELETFASDGTSLGVYKDIQPAKISDTDVNPTFTNFTYSDNNPVTYGLTGDRTILVKGYSNPRLSVAETNQAIAHKGASISKYSFSNAEQSKDYILGDYPAYADLIGVKSNALTVWAEDSRKESTKAEKLLSNLTVSGGSLTWDGDITNREVIKNFLNTDGMNFYKITDKILTPEDLLNKNVIFTYGTAEYPMVIDAIDDIESMDKSWFMATSQQSPMVVVIKQSTEFSQSTGTYFIKMQDVAYIKELHISDSNTTNGNWVEYKDIEKISFEAERKNGGTSSEVTLKLSGNIWDGNFGAVENSIKSAIYKYKKTDSDEWIKGTTELNVAKNGSSYSLEHDIAGDLGAEGFDQEESYDIYVEISDELSSVYDTFTLSAGSPALAYYKNCVSLGAPYDESLGGRVQVLGEKMEDFLKKIDSMFPNDIIGDGDPVKTGRIIDGKDEYVKKIIVSSLPNANGVSYPTGLTNVKYIKIEGSGYRSSDGTIFPLPFASGATNAEIMLTLGANNNTFQIQTWMDRSALKGEIYIFFTYNN